MRLPVLIAALFIAVSALAQERPLDGAEIRNLLPGIVAVGDGTRQTFEPHGDTLFDNGGRLSSGRWRIQDDFYCSRWPPGGGWRCYHVLVDDGEPDRLIWVDAEENGRTINRILPRER